MRISYKGDYAIKALVYLASQYNKYNEGRSQIGEISKSQDIPLKFLEHILLILKNAGYVKSHRGTKGGYAIAKDPEQITLGEIIRLMDGPTSPIACVSTSNNKYCDFESRCVLKPIWKDVRDSINGIIDNITFKELAQRDEKLKAQDKKLAMYYI